MKSFVVAQLEFDFNFDFKFEKKSTFTYLGFRFEFGQMINNLVANLSFLLC